MTVLKARWYLYYDVQSPRVSNTNYINVGMYVFRD